MNQHDPDMHEFFADMRRKDEQGSIPGYEMLQSMRRPRSEKLVMISIGLAASLLIAVIFYFNTPKKTVIAEDAEFVITLSTGGTGTQSLVFDESSIDAWQSPSDFLIEDFNE